MRLKEYSKEEAAEILSYLAKEDPFLSLNGTKWIRVEQVRKLLQEISEHLEQEAQGERTEEVDFMNEGLSLQAKQILSTLSPREERLLLRSFKVN